MSQEDEQGKYISSKEGAELLQVPRQSFFYYVESRNIERQETEGGGKDRYEYKYEDVLRVKEELHKRWESRKPRTKASEAKTESKSDARTDWCTKEDLPYIFALDCEVYGIENSAPPNITYQWWQKNQTAIRVIFDANNRKDIWGCLTLLPMQEEDIFKILRDEMTEQEIHSEHVLSYEPDKEYSCYIASCVIRPAKRHFFNLLLKSVIGYWCDHPEVNIRKLYAFALGAAGNMGEENDGLRMIRKLYFSPRYDIAENAWELDLEHYNPSPIVRGFQNCVREKRERIDK
ncbi:hypothetical protein [Ktedonobacter robiniae]|uniref:Ig-like domain-containing protein n=1 Tax=Ktedonobacter robiniae TaxID=2778365 RepID=A0ABQ3UQ11_9CHLR|nr:hypothetical protein [Ktedonobacter robiniae]GHO54783.1 hypothetical protein KSB_32580 [Ktedonobacter robiniae]